MRFSIRALLALITIAALGMVAFQSYRTSQERSLRLAQIQSELETARLAAQRDEQYRDTSQALADLRELLAENRERCEQAMDDIVEKYAAMEPREPSIFSFRTYPTLRSDTGRAPIAYRIIVPEQRSIWLKCGILAGRGRSPSDGIEGSESVLLREAPFESVGPYEFQLPAGQHVLALEVDDPQQGRLVVRARLNDQVLAEFKNVSGTTANTGSSMSTAAIKQTDYNEKRSLPSLLTLRLDVKEDPSSEEESEYSLSFWFSKQSSSFEDFPNQ